MKAQESSATAARRLRHIRDMLCQKRKKESRVSTTETRDSSVVTRQQFAVGRADS